ncbi:winged helix-turn-helix domain-containing protein [Psychrobium sp. MM17-31]|uniref:winged helix-turn-helix domain-containing protein n=1 Tax=Psychrobium sp. MM17-31 TaxID=2917758 RepID=UPI001EF56733|nr:winged helix-turn-helix domain-containing protein [Psychrobium sp. MM17-31]MCG7532984.1 winged helix-turn-helix domain-containing protein [Psychrobium sp. MM17-31]
MFYDFQTFSLDTTNRQLVIGGEAVEIDERAFVLFDALITAYPETCTKQQLLECIWPDTVVSEWSLSKLISDIRKVFKSAGYDGPLLQTVHGKGYRLAVELAKALEGESEQQKSQEQTSAKPDSTKLNINKKPLILFSVLLAIVMIAVSQFNKTNLVTQEPAGAIGRILWVDDNPSNNEKERAYFEANKIAVYPIESTEKALRLLSLYQYQAVISDMGRQEDKLAGIHLLEQMRAAENDTPFVLYTWHSTPELEKEITDLGGQAVAVDSQSLYKYIENYIAVAQQE